MTIYDAIDEEVWNVMYHSKQVASDMEWALENPDKNKLSEDQVKIFEHNLPVFRKINMLLKSLKG